jgi:phosphatidate cytidylyltransferase
MADGATGSAGGKPKSSSFADLRLRLASGVVLAAAALALTWWSVPSFAVLVAAVVLMMAWEWGGMVRKRPFDLTFAIHAAGLLLMVVLAAVGHIGLALLALFVTAVLVLLLSLGAGAVMSTFGVFYVGLPALALIWLRADKGFGFLAIVFIFLVVWTSDIAAFLSGRLIGGPKLWPRVSPNKTWAGFIGGVGVTGLAALLFAVAALSHSAPWSLGLAAMALAAVAQGGDLAESAMKRHYGVKDASGLIPGHGGFMDRVDSLVAVAVAAAAFGLLVNAHAPAVALLGV